MNNLLYTQKEVFSRTSTSNTLVQSKNVPYFELMCALITVCDSQFLGIVLKKSSFCHIYWNRILIFSLVINNMRGFNCVNFCVSTLPYYKITRFQSSGHFFIEHLIFGCSFDQKTIWFSLMKRLELFIWIINKCLNLPSACVYQILWESIIR